VILFADTFPGWICGSRSKEIDGAVLRSSHSYSYSPSLCVTRFVSDSSQFTSKRLMLKFTKFHISDCRVELKILGTLHSDVCLTHCSTTILLFRVLC